jgi:hypothetical protein
MADSPSPIRVLDRVTVEIETAEGLKAANAYTARTLWALLGKLDDGRHDATIALRFAEFKPLRRQGESDE